MNVFITGGTGLVGSHLIERLLKDGHFVYALVRDPLKLTIHHPHLKMIEGDLNHFECPFNIDVIIHSAGLVHAYDSKDFFIVNEKGTENVMKAFFHQPKIHFILISSLAAHGPYAGSSDQPVSDYGKSKKAAEDSLKKAPTTWIKTIIRPPMIIGPRDQAIFDIFKMVSDGIILLPGLHARKKNYHFVSVFDLIESIMTILKTSAEGLFYSAYPETVTYEDIIFAIKKTIHKSHLVFIPLPHFVLIFIANLLKVIHQFYPLKLRLTPDKVKELIPDQWIVQKNVLPLLDQQKYHDSLEVILEKTYEQDYRKKLTSK